MADNRYVISRSAWNIIAAELDRMVTDYINDHIVDDEATWLIIKMVSEGLYGLDEFACDAMIQHMGFPMHCPKWSDAAMGYLMMLAVMERNPYGSIDKGWNQVNWIWCDDQCWCWGADKENVYNPYCPRHVWRDQMREVEGGYGGFNERVKPKYPEIHARFRDHKEEEVAKWIANRATRARN